MVAKQPVSSQSGALSILQHLNFVLLYLILDNKKNITVNILNIGTYRSEQTVHTQIRLLLLEQSDLGMHCLSFYLHLLDASLL